jgi:hypothetical protein
MPKIQWMGLPPAFRDHLFDRLRERRITAEDLYQLKLWREPLLNVFSLEKRRGIVADSFLPNARSGHLMVRSPRGRRKLTRRHAATCSGIF